MGFTSRTTLIALFSIAAIAAAQDAATEQCIMSATQCQCSTMKPSGHCMRSQGDGTCLLGECNEGYRCDCFGFEVCSVKSCSKHTTLANVIPSDKDPFKCHLTPNAGTCTDFSSLLDTTGAADNAGTEATNNNDETTEDERACTRVIDQIESGKVEINKALRDLEQFSEQVTDQERADVEKDSDVVVAAVIKAQEEKAMCGVESAEAYKSFREASKFRAEARRKEKLAKQKEEQEKAEELKAQSKKEKCQPCEQLKAEIKQLRSERRKAAIAAGTWTKKGREHKKNSKKRRKNVEKAQLSAEEARARCIAKSNKILARLRSQ